MANALTLLRLILTPVFVILLLNHSVIPAFLVFSIASLTDFLDGYVARKSNQVTNFGKIADPLVDRIFIASAIVALFVAGKIPLWMVLIFVARDLFMITGYKIIEIKAKTNISVTFMGKLSSAFLMIVLIPLILDIQFAYYLLYIGLILALISAFDYTCKGIKLVYDKRKDAI
ncbi:MAG: CDP-diacylglycerol--glycerol-3-phosphate 3-phosphatidyltransferase [Actinobacteria bacterium]|nr:CDP-diacylglycerol--glycerol-3-phosphate 3-phosphatidyltransferase [Actinomycetota bacterium]